MSAAVSEWAHSDNETTGTWMSDLSADGLPSALHQHKGIASLGTSLPDPSYVIEICPQVDERSSYIGPQLDSPLDRVKKEAVSPFKSQDRSVKMERKFSCMEKIGYPVASGSQSTLHVATSSAAVPMCTAPLSHAATLLSHATSLCQMGTFSTQSTSSFSPVIVDVRSVKMEPESVRVTPASGEVKQSSVFAVEIPPEVGPNTKIKVEDNQHAAGPSFDTSVTVSTCLSSALHCLSTASNSCSMSSQSVTNMHTRDRHRVAGHVSAAVKQEHSSSVNSLLLPVTDMSSRTDTAEMVSNHVELHASKSKNIRNHLADSVSSNSCNIQAECVQKIVDESQKAVPDITAPCRACSSANKASIANKNTTNNRDRSQTVPAGGPLNSKHSALAADCNSDIDTALHSHSKKDCRLRQKTESTKRKFPASITGMISPVSKKKRQVTSDDNEEQTGFVTSHKAAMDSKSDDVETNFRGFRIPRKPDRGKLPVMMTSPIEAVSAPKSLYTNNGKNSFSSVAFGHERKKVNFGSVTLLRTDIKKCNAVQKTSATQKAGAHSHSTPMHNSVKSSLNNAAEVNVKKITTEAQQTRSLSTSVGSCLSSKFLNPFNSQSAILSRTNLATKSTVPACSQQLQNSRPAAGGTGKTTDLDPRKPVSTLPEELARAGWKKCWSKKRNRWYMFNIRTGTSSWDVPK